MTEIKIKEMLSDIINNGAEYECRPLCGECDYKRKNCDDTCTMTDRLYQMIADENELRWFFDHVIQKPNIYESYSMVWVSRRKKLTKYYKNKSKNSKSIVSSSISAIIIP